MSVDSHLVVCCFWLFDEVGSSCEHEVRERRVHSCGKLIYHVAGRSVYEMPSTQDYTRLSAGRLSVDVWVKKRQHLRQHLLELTMQANPNRNVGLFSKADQSPRQSLPCFFVADARDEAEIGAFEAFETTWSQRGPPGAQPCALTFGALGVWFFR